MKVPCLTLRLIGVFMIVMPMAAMADGDNPYWQLRRELQRARLMVSRQAECLPDHTAGEKQESPSRESQVNLHTAIRRAAGANGLPPALLATLVSIESAGDPCAVSRAGARGLTQLMPATATHFGLGDSFEPNGNLETGARLLKELLDKTDGNLLAAAAAYNAGEKVLSRGWHRWPVETIGYLDKVLRIYPAYTDDRWLERLPRLIPDASEEICRK